MNDLLAVIKGDKPFEVEHKIEVSKEVLFVSILLIVVLTIYLFKK